MAFSRINGLPSIEELTVPFDPTTIQEKVLRRRRQLRSRGISLVITVLVLAAVYLWKHDQLKGAGFFGVYSVVLAISLGWFVGYLISYQLARRALRRVGQGIALRIGRPGVEMTGVFVPWPEVVSVGAVRAGVGRSPLLQVKRTSGDSLSVPFDQIQVRPATLDTTARAYSAGRHGVDLEALES